VTATAALRLRGVTFSHPCRPILAGVGLDVPRGSLAVIVGSNGSGKTTLLRIAAGLLRPQSGEVLLADGTPAHEATRQGRIGYIPQHLGLVRSASVLENALLGGLRESRYPSILGRHGAGVRERARAALDLVGLTPLAGQPARTLSGGERQRVAIARTLVQEAAIVIADELVASLDAPRARDVMEICERLCQRGVTMLLALHQLDLAAGHADQVHALADGRLAPVVLAAPGPGA
jgi:phosphonate transport system ATP-binding protein